MAELSHIDLDGETLEIADEKARKHIENNNNPHEVTAEDVGLGNVPNVSTNDQTPTFTEATTLEPLSSGEKATTLFSKIAKAITTLISHLNATNPHGITKSTIGLGNVDNTSDNSKPVSTDQQDAIDAAYYNANQYTDQKISELINGAPSTLDTLKEIADAMAESEDVVAALDAAIGTKASQSELDSHLASKANPHGVTKSQVGLGNVPNVATNDQTPTYTEATTLAALNSGEKLSVAFGKIAKAIIDLISHIGNSTVHITATERNNWNAAYNSNHTHSNKSVLDGTTASFTTAEKTKLSGIAAGANVYTHPSYTARTGVPTANQTPAFGGTFSVSQPVSDATGHITAVNTRTVTIPSNVATSSMAGLMSISDKIKLDNDTVCVPCYGDIFAEVDAIGNTSNLQEGTTEFLTPDYDCSHVYVQGEFKVTEITASNVVSLSMYIDGAKVWNWTVSTTGTYRTPLFPVYEDYQVKLHHEGPPSTTTHVLYATSWV